MQQDIPSMSTEELVLLYREINNDLTSHLLDGGSWDEQQQRIITLTGISKELTRRKFEIHDKEERTA